MSRAAPAHLARGIRRMHDVMVGRWGIKCVLYRFQQVDDPDLSTMEGRIARRYQQSRESAGDEQYSEPLESRVKFDWNETMRQMYLRRQDNPSATWQEGAPIRAYFKFSHFVTTKSYIKVPFKLVDKADGYKPTSETENTERLRVHGIQPRGADVTAHAVWNLGMLRNNEARADTDTGMLDDIPKDFFTDF